MSPWMLLLVGAALLQSALVGQVDLLGARPNLVFAVVLGWTLLRGGREGLFWAMVGGLLLDLFSAAPFGTFTVAMLVTIFVIGLIEGGLLRRTALLPAGSALLASPLFHVMAIIMMLTLGWSRGWGGSLAILVPAALLDALAIHLLFPLLVRIERRAGRRAIDWR